MSYNTRRTGGTAGRPPTTQVNYHQQQTRSPSSNQQNRNANSGFTQQPVTYNSAAQPAFTTTPPMPSTQSKPAAPAQQAPPPQAAAPPTQAVAPTTAPATPAVKQEPVTPASTPKTPMETSENGEGGGTKVPFWKRRPVVKLSNKVRRARQNAKLRRILNPKNALTFLNELRPGTGKFVVREEPGWGYAATVEVDGKAFTGYGMSASRAKVQASEKALKFILLEQLSKSQQAAAETKEEPKDEEEAMDTTEQEGEEPKAKKQKVMAEDEVPWGSLAAFALHKLFSEWQKEGPVEAPLAQPYPIEKFDEDIGASGDDQFYTRRPLGPPDFGYRGRGFPPYPSRGRGFAPYPSPRGPPPPGFGPAPGRRPPVPPSPAAAQLAQWTSTGPPKPQGAPIGAAPMKKIPEDANQRHPVMLLNQLRPNVVYNETREGEQPRVTFIITIDVDGKQYVGRGRNKKEAKKMAAKAALAPMGIVYSDEV